MAQALEKGNPAPAGRNVGVTCPADYQPLVERRAGRDLAPRTKSHGAAFAQSIEQSVSSLHQGRTAIKPFRLEAGLTQSQNFPSTTDGRNQDARPRMKVLLHHHSLPVKQAALVVFGRGVFLRVVIVIARDGIQIVRAEIAEPKAFMERACNTDPK